MSAAAPILEPVAEPHTLGAVGEGSPLRDAWRRFARDRWAVGAAGFLAALHLVALAAPWIVPHLLHQSAYHQRIMDRVVVAGRTVDVVTDDGIPLGPSPVFPLGADLLGRDVLSRILYGARISLLVSTLGTLLALVVGAFAGLLAGYYRGILDMLISRLIDATMSIPILLLAIALAAVSRGGGIIVMVTILALVNWTYLARLVRAEVLSLRERDFIEAARALGASDWKILVRHLLPNLTGPVIVFATLSMAGNILLESALSYLGVGIRPPTPSWGNMIQEGIPLYNVAWWITLFPGLAILITVVAYNLVGDSLKAAFDPSSAGRGES